MSRKRLFSKKTKIIATIGPASNTLPKLKRLIRSGVDFFRINASHLTDPTAIAGIVALVRSASDELGENVGVFLDLQGPKIRVGEIESGEVHLKTGGQIEIVEDDIVGNADRISVSYPKLVSEVADGEELFMDDGRLRLVVSQKKRNKLVCKVLKGGVLSSRKGVNLPTSRLSISALSQKDLRDVKAAVESNVDMIALSFVAYKEDVEALRQVLDDLGGQSIQIISKIERQLAVDNVGDIIDASDAVMVARGDLGVEIGVENVPRIQKMIIRYANRLLKPVIVATQMLETMIHETTATRAEVSDVANAVYDRCDTVMLSGETAVGVDPVAAVKTMRQICRASDRHMMQIKREDHLRAPRFLKPSRPLSICQAADQIAEANKATALMVFTSSGSTPLIASRLNPSVPIIAPTDQDVVCKRMALYRGVIPMMMPVKFDDIHRWTAMIEIAVDEAKKTGLLKAGDVLVVTAGIPIGISNGINSIRIITVED